MLIDTTKEEKVLFHPNMANRYQQEIRHLLGALNTEESRAEATMILRSLIDRIVVTPTDAGDRLTVDLIGDLAGILSIATTEDKQSLTDGLSKLQPMQNSEKRQDSAGKGKAADNGDLVPTALVAGKRTNRDLNAQEALVAGGRSHRDLIAEKAHQEALVAGAGFEPATFRL